MTNAPFEATAEGLPCSQTMPLMALIDVYRVLRADYADAADRYNESSDDADDKILEARHRAAFLALETVANEIERRVPANETETIALLSAVVDFGALVDRPIGGIAHLFASDAYVQAPCGPRPALAL